MEEIKKPEQAEYEVVDMPAGTVEADNFEVVSETKELGVVVTNFNDLIPAVESRMATYKTLKATPENLQSIYDMRANLRKVKTALKDEWKKAKEAFDKPLIDHEAAYKKLLSIVDDAIESLDAQYNSVDLTLKKERYNERAKIVEEGIRAKLTPDELAFYKTCDPEWTCNIRWQNKDYKQKEIDGDIARIVTGVQNAWSMLEGDYRAQMLEVFAKTGDLGQAMSEGKKLREQAERFREIERVRLEREEAARQARMARIENPAPQPTSVAPAPISEAPKEAAKPVPPKQEHTYTCPSAIGQNLKICKGLFTIRAPRYLIQWLLDVAAAEGISVDKEVPNAE